MFQRSVAHGLGGGNDPLELGEGATILTRQ